MGRGRAPTIYGGRTFRGWVNYYEVWGVRSPGLRAVQDHYSKCRKKGLSNKAIIALQKRLWLEGISARHSNK